MFEMDEKLKDYPSQKKQLGAKAATLQRCYMETIEAMANCDINISKIKTKVK